MPILRWMGTLTHNLGIARCLVCVLFLFAAGWGCSGGLHSNPSYEYFAAPESDDAWSRKIEFWQERERAPGARDPVADPAPVVVSEGDVGEKPTESENLESKYTDFLAEKRRGVAREFTNWVQSQAHHHYVPDGPIDHWATLQETFRSNGDDCDGLELLAYNFLRDLGFGDDRVYRAIVVRRSDGQHHMVTLWFEDPGDPWVIDPTGAMTRGMPRMSELPSWVPLKVFGEDRDFTVRRLAFHASENSPN